MQSTKEHLLILLTHLSVSDNQKPTMAICDSINELVYIDELTNDLSDQQKYDCVYLLKATLSAVVENWEHFSGSYIYPIKDDLDTNFKFSGRAVFEACEDYWAGGYGARRIELLGLLIEHLKLQKLSPVEETVSNILINLLDPDMRKADSAICDHVLSELAYRVRTLSRMSPDHQRKCTRLFNQSMRDACEEWKHYSGSTTFPVSPPICVITPSSAFSTCINFWTGEYGRRRIELVERMLIIIKGKEPV